MTRATRAFTGPRKMGLDIFVIQPTTLRAHMVELGRTKSKYYALQHTQLILAKTYKINIP